MTITQDTKKEETTGTEPNAEKVVPAHPYHPYGYNGHQRANSNISISSNSKLGQRHLTHIVEKALKENGFTNVKLHTFGGYDPLTNEPRAEVLPAPDSVLAALQERNPSFFRSPIGISSHEYHMNDIPPDSEYPCAGAPVKNYETGGYGRTNVVAVDEAGGKEHFGSFASMSDAERIASLLNEKLV